MKAKFCTTWKASSQARRQRKYIYNAPLHIKRKFLKCNLSKFLRTETKKRNIIVIKGDKIRVMRGDFKEKEGTVREVDTKKTRIYVEEIKKKADKGKEIFVPLRPSNVQIIEMNLKNQNRVKKRKTSDKPNTANAIKKQDKTEKTLTTKK